MSKLTITNALKGALLYKLSLLTKYHHAKFKQRYGKAEDFSATLDSIVAGMSTKDLEWEINQTNTSLRKFKNK